MSLTVVYILVAILLFGLLVLVHEFGHFLTAKLSGVQVNEFSLFMGPAIWKRQKGETLYSLRCIPIGGYCAMEGEDGDSDNPRAFGRAKVWKRLLILVAGSFMNLVAGLLIMTIYVASVYQAIPTRAVASAAAKRCACRMHRSSAATSAASSSTASRSTCRKKHSAGRSASRGTAASTLSASYGSASGTCLRAARA